MSGIRQAQQAITEGFICANCRRQFGGVDELLTHYELCQKRAKGSSEQGGSDGGINSNGGFKRFLGKAKERFKFDSPLQQSSGPPTSSSSSQDYYGGGASGGGGGNPFQQDKGSPTSSTPTYYSDHDNAVEVQSVSRSWTEEFRKIREGRMERYAAESNKLKIRLSKLVSGLEKFPHLTTKSTAGFQDSAEWKLHEKSVVSWLDEKPVTRCPECAQTFSILKRKHHCRLCGSILCNDCSDFVPLAEAIEILHSEKKIRDDTACASITFRTCSHCARILRQESQSPLNRLRKGGSTSERRLLELYDQIRAKMTEIDELLPQLVSVVDSIRSGESLYSKEEANSHRSTLLRSTEQIDLLSKQISVLNTESSSMMLLQKRIRQNCVVYIREFLRSVPVVPDTAEDSSSTSSSVGGASSIVATGDGWSISAPERYEADLSSDRPTADLDDNPIQQQIKNVKFYIQQAQAAGRMDEVEMLASSLRDLLLWQNEQESR